DPSAVRPGRAAVGGAHVHRATTGGQATAPARRWHAGGVEHLPRLFPGGVAAWVSHRPPHPHTGSWRRPSGAGSCGGAGGGGDCAGRRWAVEAERVATAGGCRSTGRVSALGAIGGGGRAVPGTQRDRPAVASVVRTPWE